MSDGAPQVSNVWLESESTQDICMEAFSSTQMQVEIRSLFRTTALLKNVMEVLP